jgi:hydrogenase maturation protease
MNAHTLTAVRTRSRALGVQVLVCGSADRGDDAAPIAAARLLRDTPDKRVGIKVVGQLDVDDLLAIPRGAGVVVVDTAVGIAPGRVLELPLDGLVHHDRRVRPRSSHALEIPEVVGVANVIRGHPLDGAVVVVGGARFDIGEPLSEAVARAIPTLASTMRRCAERLLAHRDAHDEATRPAGPH